MPQKGQMNKSRTAKSNGKHLKLKWWYVLPVIAIVAVAGYAVIRYSQAAVEINPVSPNSFNGGTATQNKNGVPIRVIGGNPVRIKYGNGQYDRTATIISALGLRDKWVCVESWVGNYNNQPAAWSINMKQNINILPFRDRYQTVNELNKTYFSKNTWDRRCEKITSSNIVQVDITITNGFPGNRKDQPFVGVSKVWWQERL